MNVNAHKIRAKQKLCGSLIVEHLNIRFCFKIPHFPFSAQANRIFFFSTNVKNSTPTQRNPFHFNLINTNRFELVKPCRTNIIVFINFCHSHKLPFQQLFFIRFIAYKSFSLSKTKKNDETKSNTKRFDCATVLFRCAKH